MDLNIVSKYDTQARRTTSRTMKKIDPVRMLESQMASLRQSYENWVDDTPELETDFPSEEEMAIFEEEEKAHKETFAKLEHRASQFSQTLGAFGKLGSSEKLRPALHGFIKEGIRFSFSNLDDQGEDSLVLGSRLSFLLLLSKYASWAKKDKEHKAAIQEYVDELESDMRNHEEFEEVHADDLDSLATFRQIIGLKTLSVKSGASVASGRSGASARSGASVFSNLDDGDDSLDDLPSPAPSTGTASSKRSAASRSTGGSSRAGSKLSKTLPTLEEIDMEESPQDAGESDAESHFSGNKRTHDDEETDSSDVEEKPRRASKRGKN